MSRKKIKFNDGIENLSTGLGSATDAKTSTEFSVIDLSLEQIETAYRYDWVFPKAVDIPAKDMTKKWLLFNGKEKQKKLIKEEYRRLQVKRTVRKALIYKALYGVSYIVIQSEGKSLASKLDANSNIKKLHIYHKFSFAKKDKKIHESRIYAMEQNEFQDSLLFKLQGSILNFITSLEIPASLMHKSDIDFLSIKGLAQALSKCKKDNDCKKAEERVLKRIQTMYEQLSIFKLGVKDSEEQYESHTKDLSNYDNLQATYMQVVAGAADIPLTRFFGTAPRGMNATGQGDLTNYHESLSGMQDEFIEPFLDMLNEVLFESNNISYKNFSFEFAPIRDLTPTEKVDIQVKEANIIALFIDELDPATIAEAVSRLAVFDGIKVISNEQEED